MLQGKIYERQQELNVLKEDLFGGLIERLRAEGSKEADRVAQLIDELKKELGR